MMEMYLQNLLEPIGTREGLQLTNSVCWSLLETKSSFILSTGVYSGTNVSGGGGGVLASIVRNTPHF